MSSTVYERLVEIGIVRYSDGRVTSGAKSGQYVLFPERCRSAGACEVPRAFRAVRCGGQRHSPISPCRSHWIHASQRRSASSQDVEPRIDHRMPERCGDRVRELARLRLSGLEGSGCALEAAARALRNEGQRRQRRGLSLDWPPAPDYIVLHTDSRRCNPIQDRSTSLQGPTTTVSGTEYPKQSSPSADLGGDAKSAKVRASLPLGVVPRIDGTARRPAVATAHPVGCLLPVTPALEFRARCQSQAELPHKVLPVVKISCGAHNVSMVGISIRWRASRGAAYLAYGPHRERVPAVELALELPLCDLRDLVVRHNAQAVYGDFVQSCLQFKLSPVDIAVALGPSGASLPLGTSS